MEAFHLFWIILPLILVDIPQVAWSMGVSFLQKGDLYVAVGRTLVLEAEFELQPGEKIRLFTWDRNNGTQEVRLATNTKTPEQRISVNENGNRLKIRELKPSDYGTYTVTVTDVNGYQKYASRKVIAVSRTPEASFSMQCSMKKLGDMWDQAVYSWEVNGKEVANDTGILSEDGSSLQLLGNILRNYSCTIDSSQGTRTIFIQAEDPDAEPCEGCGTCCTGWIVTVVIEALFIVGLLLWILVPRSQKSSRNNVTSY